MDIKTRLGRRDKGRYHILPKGKGHQGEGDITSLYIYATSMRVFNFINSTRYKVRDNPNLSIGDDCNTPLSPIVRSCGQKQQNVGIKCHIHQIALIDICRAVPTKQ